jgi:hypothetical protein
VICSTCWPAVRPGHDFFEVFGIGWEQFTHGSPLLQPGSARAI